MLHICKSEATEKRSDLKAKRLKSEAESVGSLNYKGGVIGAEAKLNP